MRFTADEAAKFWTLYKPFEQQRKAIGDEKVALIKAYAASYNAGPVADARAKELMASAIAIEEKSLASKRQFLTELQKALPGKTVARYLHGPESHRSVDRAGAGRRHPAGRMTPNDLRLASCAPQVLPSPEGDRPWHQEI